VKYLREGRNVCILRTCSKIHGLAALRIGYGLASKGVAAILQKARQPFNANAIAQAGALAGLADTDHIERTRAVNREGLAFWQDAFRERGMNFIPSVANFVMVEVGDGDLVFSEMLKRGVIVRALRSYKQPAWIRISVGTPEQNRRGLEVLDEVLAATGGKAG
jgi:histidinol-phosphate aminotransferase